MDATFKLCRHPFTQLFTVNAFVKKDDHVKQVPLAFVLMSGRKKGDYKAVLQALLSILPNNSRVKKITLDFEKAMWSVTRQVLPNIKLMGCSFHFTQATLCPPFATFTLHRPPLSHASPLLCGNLSHFGSAAPSSIALHDLFRFMIFLTARFCFFLSWRAAQPAEVRARLLLISKERKLG